MKERLLSALLGVLAFLLVLEGLLRMLGVACKHRDSAAPELASRDRSTKVVLCVGDSFTWGAGAPVSKSWPRQLERLLNADGRQKYIVVNRGMGGQNSARLVQEFQYNLDSVRPDLVILCTGSANGWDPYGHAAAGGERTWKDSITDALYRVRVFRLAKLLYMNASERHAKSLKARSLAAMEARKKAFEEDVARQVPTEQRLRAQKCAQEAARRFVSHGHEEAAQCLREGLALDPYSGDLYLDLSRLHELKSDWSEARRWCEKGIEANPHDVRLRTGLANLLLRQRLDNEAFECLDAAQDIEPKDPEVLRLKGLVLASKQRYAEALEYVKQALEVGGSSNHQIRLDEANIHMQMGNYEAAIEGLQSLVDSGPGNEHYWTLMGEAHLRMGRYEQAVRCNKTAMACLEQKGMRIPGPLYMRLGTCFVEARSYNEAVTWYEKAAALSPNEAAEALADAYRLAGRKTEARTWYLKALQANPQRDRHIQGWLDELDGKPRPFLTAAQPVPTRFLSPTEAWIKADICKVIAMCRAADVALLMHSYPAQTMRTVLVNVSTENRIPFVDHLPTFLELKDRDKYFAPDMHCNELGYGVMAKDLEPKVREMLPAAAP